MMHMVSCSLRGLARGASLLQPRAQAEVGSTRCGLLTAGNSAFFTQLASTGCSVPSRSTGCSVPFRSYGAMSTKAQLGCSAAVFGRYLQGQAPSLVAASHTRRSFAAWWTGGPKKKGAKKRPKFIRVGESLYRVQNYRLAYRRVYGRDVPMSEQQDFSERQRYAVEASKEKHKKKSSSNPPHARQRAPSGVLVYPFERR
eukprot:TRINITY_DN69926_c0_g1_i1.p1 TRINITY_DN69926_c0_g1~~TRINITY_DN69926_c0_g1_i1.p1  ORF type:complete len:209 (-),score=29.51 TRINITY_DN69926_c0_g1_i1:17-613(-)